MNPPCIHCKRPLVECKPKEINHEEQWFRVYYRCQKCQWNVDMYFYKEVQPR
jgi:hypothetical protein